MVLLLMLDLLFPGLHGSQLQSKRENIKLTKIHRAQQWSR